MKRIKNTDIYVGNMYDFEDVRNSRKWAAVHCCRDPYHKELVGYGGFLPPNHPNYLYCVEGNRLALNLIDTNKFNPRYLDTKRVMLHKAFDFIDKHLWDDYNILIHCNEGLSRGPCVAVAYLGFHNIDGYGEMDFPIAMNRFSSENCYPVRPRTDIFRSVNALWDEITKGGQK